LENTSFAETIDAARNGKPTSQYKDYVLVLLFVRYVSDKYADQKNALVIIPEGGGFADLVKLKGKPNIGEGINVVFSRTRNADLLPSVVLTVQNAAALGMDFGPASSAANLHRKQAITNLRQFSLQYTEINLGSEVDVDV
jgi:hypothetical protein